MSLRGRLVAGMAVIAILLVCAAVVITRNTESYLIQRVDAQMLSSGFPGRGFDGDGGGPGAPPGGGPGFSSAYVGVVQADGTVARLAAPNLTGDDLASPAVSDAMLAEASDTGRSGPETVGTEPASELRYRVIAARDEHSGVVLVFGLPLNDVDAAVGRLVRVEVVATAIIVGLLALVTWWVIRLGVRPIKRMTQTASAIAGGDLSHRVPDVAPGTEAGELGIALNQMLGRIEESFDQRTRSEDRLRQFVADASHELRTPVTTIRGYAELFRAGGLEERSELTQAMRRTEQEAVRMGALIEDLLLLARLDQGRALDRDPVDLGVLVVDAASDARVVEPDRPISASVQEAVIVVGDEARLRQVVANLVANALVHTPPGTPVRVVARTDGDRGVLEVIDEGPGMAPEVAAQVFERFFRADPARSRHHGGAGLGLAIVKSTIDAHGGEVEILSAPDRGTTVRVSLPRA